MKKLRRFLTVLLFINFSWGMATGMEPLNFWLVMANGTAGEFYYNDPEHLVVRENEDPRRYFENVAEDHILSMAFEGTVCHMLWYGTNPGIKKREYAENERRKAERDQDT